MPYNTAPIAPRKDVTGQAQLPLARVKKIIAVDPEIAMCSNNAAFVITLATEMFIQYLAEQAHNVVKSEKKPRRNIQYRDLANAVALQDVLEFLSDIVPRTVPFKEVKSRAKARGDATASGIVEPGQTTLDRKTRAMNGNIHGADVLCMEGSNDDTVDDDFGMAEPNAQLEMEIRGIKTDEQSNGRKNELGNEVRDEVNEGVVMS